MSLFTRTVEELRRYENAAGYGLEFTAVDRESDLVRCVAACDQLVSGHRVVQVEEIVHAN